MSAETLGVLVCGGDMNIRSKRSKMESSASNLGHSKPIINRINSIMEQIGIVDVWRELNPTGPDYTLIYLLWDYFFTLKRE